MIGFLKNNRTLTIIVIIGLILRLIFILFFARQYFGRENIFVDNDTWAWLSSFINLIEHGAYTVDVSNEYGYFLRMPGYSFFLGIIYYMTGQNQDITYHAVAIMQIIADTVNIIFIFKISKIIFQKKRIALMTALIYACYPFAIVWTTIAYSESLSVFFMLLSINYFLKKTTSSYFFSGCFISISLLFRPQIAILVPIFFLIIILHRGKKFKNMIRDALIFSLAIFIVYGPWPLRNYFIHDKIILTQDLRGAKNWNEDVIAFMQYIYSVKSEWEPQFSQIITNKYVEFPKTAYTVKVDSLKLVHAIHLSKNCGSGFSHWKGYWKEPILDDGCSKEIAKLFNDLRENQIKLYPWKFYLYIPLKNLKKAVFKSSLYDKKGIRKYASYLFYYRTFLILIGISGGILMLIKKKNGFSIFIVFPIILYLTLCFGTGVQFRNIEMRYFLPVDILLVLPAAFILDHIITFFHRKKQT